MEAHRAHPDHPGRDPADPIDVEGDGSAALDRESLRALDEDAADADVDRPCLPRAVAAADHGLQFDREAVQLPAVPDLAVAYHGDEALCERLGEVRRADGLLIGLGDPIGCVLRHFVDALGPLAHALDEAGRFRGALGEFRDRGVLLADRGADGAEDRLHALNDIHDPLDGRHRGAGAVAQARDAGADVVCRIAGLDGEGFDLGRDDREAPPGSARASRLDGGVEGEEIRLPGDRGDRVDDPDDLLRGLGKLGNEPVGAPRRRDRLADVGSPPDPWRR